MLKSLDNIADWAINLEDSKFYLEFTSTLRTIIKQKVFDFNKNYILSKKKSKHNQNLTNDYKMILDIYLFFECFLHVFEGLTSLTKNLAEIPTKQRLKEIIIGWNNNVGLYRKWFLDGLKSLNRAKEESDSKELSENLTKLIEQFDCIITHFQNNFGSKIAVKLEKKTKRLNVIRTSLT